MTLDVVSAIEHQDVGGSIIKNTSLVLLTVLCTRWLAEQVSFNITIFDVCLLLMRALMF